MKDRIRLFKSWIWVDYFYGICGHQLPLHNCYNTLFLIFHIQRKQQQQNNIDDYYTWFDISYDYVGIIFFTLFKKEVN